ncbi:MAG: hypothetical protein R3C59_27395 [Planctomycetaceae bacterium]
MKNSELNSLLESVDERVKLLVKADGKPVLANVVDGRGKLHRLRPVDRGAFEKLKTVLLGLVDEMESDISEQEHFEAAGSPVGVWVNCGEPKTLLGNHHQSVATE